MHNAPYAPAEFFGISPYQSLGSSAQTYAWELAHELGSSEEMVACTLLAMFAAGQIGAECVVSANYTIALSLYIVVGAPPSAGKTPIIERMLPVLNRLIAKHILLSAKEQRSRMTDRAILETGIKLNTKKAAKLLSAAARKEVADHIDSLKEELESLPIPCSPIMGDMSIYAFAKELSARDGQGICIDAEGSLLSELNTVAAAQLSPLLRAWSNESISDITKNEQIQIPKPALVMMAMWQIDPLFQVLRNPKYYANGLVPRFLPHIDPPRPPMGKGPDTSTEAEYWFASQLESILMRAQDCKHLSGDSPKFHLTEEAYRVFLRFKNHVAFLQGRGQAFERYKEIAGKLDVQAVRLAMALHAMEAIDWGNMEIDAGTMLRACNLSLHFARNTTAIIELGPWDEAFKDALPLIKSIAAWQPQNFPHSGFMAEDLRRPNGISKAKCDRILHWMAANQWIYQQIEMRPTASGELSRVEIWVPNRNFNELL